MRQCVVLLNFSCKAHVNTRYFKNKYRVTEHHNYIRFLATQNELCLTLELKKKMMVEFILST